MKDNPSRLKVEKVVRPPQKPTARSKYRSERRLLFLTAQPRRIPIIRQPTKFTNRVDQGNPLFEVVRNFESKNRKRLPNPPPKKT